MDSQWQVITKKKPQKQKHKKHIGISTLHVRVLKENIHIYTCTQMNTHVIKWSTGMREKKNNDVHISWYKIYCVDHQTNCDIHSFNTKKNNDFLKVNKTKHLHTHVSHAHIKNWRGCKSLQNFEILVM